MTTINYETLFLAALFHDFQRFCSKSPNQFVEENRELFERYVDVDNLRKALAGEDSVFNKIIRDAKTFSPKPAGFSDQCKNLPAACRLTEADFEAEMQELRKKSSGSFEGFLVVLNSLLERYISDVSLYTHVKNTAVFAGNQWLSQQPGNKKSGVLVLSELSGIQDYVFSLKNPGAEKCLRARAFISF